MEAAVAAGAPVVAARPRMLYLLEQPYALACRSLALETYYHDQLAIASAPGDILDGGGAHPSTRAPTEQPHAGRGQLPVALADALLASLELLRHPLPLTVRANAAASRRGESAVAALAAALGGWGGSGCGSDSSDRPAAAPTLRRLQPVPWVPGAWQVVACPTDEQRRTAAPLASASSVDANRVTELLIRLQKCGEVAQQEHGSLLPAWCLAPVRKKSAKRVAVSPLANVALPHTR